MSNLGSTSDGPYGGSSLFSHTGVRHRNIEASTDRLTARRFEDLAGTVQVTPAAPMANGDAQEAEAETVGWAQAVTEAADESDTSTLALTVPVDAKNEAQSTTEAGQEGAPSVGSVLRMIAIAQRLHDEHVSEGQETRRRLINEGQSYHDRVVEEARVRKEQLLSTGQAKYDEFVSVGEAKHDALIGDAKAVMAQATAEHESMMAKGQELATGLVAEAQQTKAEVLQTLDQERSLLQQKIDELRTFERKCRASLKDHLTGQLIELEQTGPDQGGR